MIRDELLKRTEEILTEAVAFPETPAKKVQEAMAYALLAGGKRIRPVLLGLTYAALGGEGNMAEPFMAAIEMIHTSSLVHDDLPALDNDTLRRGRPTVHVAFGESAAILAGDALINYAYETLFRACFDREYTSSRNADAAEETARKIRAAKVLAEAGGITGMLGGQSADVVLSGEKLSEEERNFIYLNKTGALLRAPMEAGAILAGAPEEAVRLAREAGELIGLAFQVQDDILDVTGDAESLGKEAGQDERNDKSTYVAAHGLDEARAYVDEKTEAALGCLAGIKELLPVREDAFAALTELAKSLAGRMA